MPVKILGRRKEAKLIHHRNAVRVSVCALAIAAFAGMQGCTVVGFIFMAADEYKKSGSHIEKAEYTGLVDKNFAVIVTADRMIQASYPEIVPQMTTSMSQRLAENVDAQGYVPGMATLSYQYNHPSWSSKSYGEVAKELGVERLIVIDIQEFRLNDPGNRHIWDGSAAATIAVIEADGPFPDDISHEHFVHVTFPDSGGYGPDDLSRHQMISVLKSRFINRASWPFYDAKIPNDLDY
ncbi:MAG: hypothetical protein COB69_00135 [Phycisphaera sp.]|nr:MAG: hypothetical protein COB69_00135 [Phycisphaera sp.]